MHASRQEALLIPNNTCQHEQQQALQRKPMQPLKAVSGSAVDFARSAASCNEVPRRRYFWPQHQQHFCASEQPLRPLYCYNV